MKAFIPSAVSRAMYAIPLGMFGFFHFMGADQMKGMVPDLFPAPTLWVYVVGIALLAAMISIIWGKMARTASYLLGLMLLVFVVSIYLPMVLEGSNDMAMGLLLKEIALAGAAFFIGNQMEN